MGIGHSPLDWLLKKGQEKAFCFTKLHHQCFATTTKNKMNSRGGMSKNRQPQWAIKYGKGEKENYVLFVKSMASKTPELWRIFWKFKKNILAWSKGDVAKKIEAVLLVILTYRELKNVKKWKFFDKIHIIG